MKQFNNRITHLFCGFVIFFILFVYSPSPASAAIAVDVAGTGSGTGTTVDITGPNVGSGSNRVLLVGIAQGNSAATLTSVTWDQGGTNQAMTRISSVSNASDTRVELWRLVAPTSGAKTLRIVSPSSVGMAVGIVSYTGVDQTTPEDTPPTGTTGAPGSTPSITVTSATSDLVIDAASTKEDSTANTAGTNQTERAQLYAPLDERIMMSEEAGAASVPMTWTGTFEEWAQVAASLNPASESPTNTPTPTSTPTNTPTPTPTSPPTHTNSNFSLSAWVNPNSSIATKALIVKNSEIRLVTDASGNPLCQITNNASWQTAATSATALSLNAWQHVACTYDKQTLRVFVNGVLTGSQSLTVAIDNTSNSWRFGSDQGGTYGDYNGKMDDVRIYNYARTPGQIIEDMNAGHPAPGSPIGSAVGHWRFDEGALNTCSGGANDFCDSSINTNDLAFSTTTGGITNSGKFGKAWNGTGAEWLSRADDADFDVSATDDYSISMWFKSDSATNPPGGNEYLINKENATTAGYSVYANTSGYLCFGIDDDTTWDPDIESCTTTDYYDTTWHHVTAVRNVTLDETRIYIDAVSKDSDSDTTTATLANSLSLYLGDRTGTDDGNEFRGDLDEVQIFRSALTADQVKVLYNQSSGVVWGALSTDASGNASWSSDRSYCPPGDATATCGPVAYWKMDEGSWTNDCSTDSVFDSSGNGAVGDACPNSTGPTGDAIGKFGNAGSFDGNDYLTMGNTNDQTTNDFTISAWIKRSDITSNHVIMSKGGAAEPSYVFVIMDTDVLRFIIRDSVGQTIVNSTSTITDTNWHYVVVTVDRDANATFFIDGVQKESGSISTRTGSLSNADDFEIGRDRAQTTFANGLLDEVRMYSYLRTPAQIAWDYNRGAPLAHYKFDECSLAIAYNSAKDGNGDAAGMNGTITPQSLDNTTVGNCSSGTATEVWNDGTNGKRNSAFGADGDDDYTTVSDNANLRFDSSTQDFSVFAWVKRASATSDDYIVSKEEAANDGWVILIDATNDLVTCSVNSTDVSSSLAITDTNWHHVGCTVDREGNGQVYIDGKANGSAVATSGITMATTGAMNIGARGYTLAGTYFDGLIDDVRIYHYALTAQQVKTVMNQGAVSFAPITGSP